MIDHMAPVSALSFSWMLIISFFFFFQPPLSSTNFLFEMDKTTQDVIEQILSARKLGMTGSVKISGAGAILAEVPSDMNASQLNRYRRQFLTYMKMHTTATITIDKIPSMFVQFLNSNFK